MKIEKIIGTAFIVIGILFAILGAVRYTLTLTEKNDRIYTTASIVRIDERETGDPEFPVEYTAYVELEANGETVTSELNTYKPSFEIEKQIEVYYFEENLQTVYEAGSDSFYPIFALVGLAFAALGAKLSFRKRRSA